MYSLDDKFMLLYIQQYWMSDQTERSTGADIAEEMTATFATLGNETRLRIVRALWEVPGGEATFSELQAAVEMRDSGQFNYHLNKLVGRFVQKEDNRYRLSSAGVLVLGAIFSGSYTTADRVPPYPFGDTCLNCGATLLATYEDEQARVFCPSCPTFLLNTYVPPRILEQYGRDQVHVALDHWGRLTVETLRLGICTNCHSRVDPELRHEEADVDVTLVAYECKRCPKDSSISLGMYLMRDPAVVSFHHEHGVYLESEPFWRLPFLMEASGDLLSEDPVVVEKRIRAGDEVLVTTIREGRRREASDEHSENEVDERPTEHPSAYTSPRFDVTFEPEAAEEASARQ
jgi:DNA-binding transcriptional ArsR family regulator